jgi:hypothetical protein
MALLVICCDNALCLRGLTIPIVNLLIHYQPVGASWH